MMYHLFFTHSVVVEKPYRTELGCLYFCASANPIKRRF
nr:MAG TPA_asm: 3'-5' exonuclease [Caudoviricetes sp.]